MRSLTVGSLTVVAVLLAGTSQLAAQTPFVAFSGGATLSEFDGVDIDSKWGMTAGGVVGFRPLGYVITNLEANWIQKGSGDTRLQYIELPLLIGVGTKGDLRVGIYSGIGIGFAVSCSGPSVLAGVTCDRKNSTEWSWPIGVQAGGNIDPATFFALDVRYSVGLSEVFEASDVTNRTWQFRVYVGRWIG
jgi:hypothetical protein